MSLFSDTNKKSLTPNPLNTAPAGNSGEADAIFRLLSLSVILSLIIGLTMVSIFMVRLCPVPNSPGTQSDENRSFPQFVQALDSLQKSDISPATFLKGGEVHDADI